MHRHACFLTLMAILALPAVAAPVYRWVDANGRTVFSDLPPPNGKGQKLDMRGAQPVVKTPLQQGAASAPAGDLENQIKSLNEKVRAENLRIKRENCRVSRENLTRIEQGASGGKSDETALAAARSNVKTWCTD